jgi:hypothetical protein
MPKGVGYASSNVVAGAGLELNYVQNRVFAYSGLKAATTAVKTYLSFQTGADTIVGTLQTNAPVDDDTSTVGAVSATEVLLNGVKIAILKTDSKDEDQPASERMKLILPPYTTVLVTMIDDANESDRYGSVSFTGKVL